MAADGTVLVIDKIAPKNGAFIGVVDSSQAVNNTTEFNNNLSGADTTIQKALDTLDNLSVGGGVSVYSATATANFPEGLSVSSAVFNEDGNPIVTRFEGDFDENLLYIDGDSDSVGISTNAPERLLGVDLSAFGPLFHIAGSANVNPGSLILSGSFAQNLLADLDGPVNGKVFSLFFSESTFTFRNYDDDINTHTEPMKIYENDTVEISTLSVVSALTITKSSFTVISSPGGDIRTTLEVALENNSFGSGSTLTFDSGPNQSQELIILNRGQSQEAYDYWKIGENSTGISLEVGDESDPLMYVGSGYTTVLSSSNEVLNKPTSATFSVMQATEMPQSLPIFAAGTVTGDPFTVGVFSNKFAVYEDSVTVGDVNICLQDGTNCPSGANNLTVRKTTDQTSTSSSTIVDIDEMALTVAANTSYNFEYILFSTANATSTGLGFLFHVPEGFEHFRCEYRLPSSATGESMGDMLTPGTTIQQGSSAGQIALVNSFYGALTTGGTAGTIQPQFRVESDLVSGTILRGSYGKLYR